MKHVSSVILLGAALLVVAPARAQQTGVHAEQGTSVGGETPDEATQTGAEGAPPQSGPDAQVAPGPRPGGETEAVEDEAGEEPQAGEHPTRTAGEAPQSAEEQETDEAGPAGTTVGYAGRPESPDRYRLVIPPLLIERDGAVRTNAFFPFFFQRSAPDDEQLLAGIYFRRRGAQGNADAVAPFWFNFWDDHSSAWVVPPVYSYQRAGVWDFGVAPLVFAGAHGRSSYLVVPPLLLASWRTSSEANTIAGPYWRVRRDENVDWGIFPLVWSLQHVTSDTEVVAPFLFRHHDDEAGRTTTVVPPFYLHEFDGGVGWGVSPLAYWESSQHGIALTLPPLLFHYSDNDHGGRHVITPIFGLLEDPAETCAPPRPVDAAPCVPHVSSSTLVTPVYQNFRGATWLDATAPFFFAWGDPREGSGHWLVPPLFYRETSPGVSHTVVAPFFASFSERGRYETWATLLAAHWESRTRNANATWAFPNVQVSNDETSSTVNVWPLFFHTEAPTWRHNIVLGLYWDFEHDDRHARETVAFPFVWRFASGPNVSQLVFNTYYHHWRDHGVAGWEVHVFPFFAWGSHGPDDEWWSILYGLAGYQRHGTRSRVQALWVIDVDTSSTPALPPPR